MNAIENTETEKVPGISTGRGHVKGRVHAGERKKMGEEQRKEVGQEFAAEKTECLTKPRQTAEDALLADAKRRLKENRSP